MPRLFGAEEHTNPGDLPSGTSLFAWVFLVLPQPKPALAEQRFRQKWLNVGSLSQENASSPDDILWQVGHAISSLKINGRPLSLSDGEQSYLTAVVERWSETPVPHDFFPPMENQRREPTRRALEGLPSVLAAIHISESLGEKLLKKVQDLNQSKMPGFKLIAGLVKAMPNRLDEFSMWMRTGLAAEDDTLAGGAAIGLYHWLTTSADADSQTPPPPDDLVRPNRCSDCDPQESTLSGWLCRSPSGCLIREAARSRRPYAIWYCKVSVLWRKSYGTTESTLREMI